MLLASALSVNAWSAKPRLTDEQLARMRRANRHAFVLEKLRIAQAELTRTDRDVRRQIEPALSHLQGTIASLETTG